MLGSQSASFYIAPSPRGFCLDHAQAAIDLAAGYGLVLDEWQQAVVRAWMRTTKAGRWCAGTWCVSVPRQNGKNGALEAVELYCLVVLGMKILHTSHLLSSARKAFKRLLHFFGQKVDDPHARFPELNALVKEIRRTNGQEAVELHTGGLIELGARTGGAGRGSSFDILVIDEGQEYEPDEQEALKPTTSAAPSGDPVTIFMGTPPADVSERGEPFVRVRNNAILGKSARIAWVEHSAPGEVDRMTDEQLRGFVRNQHNWAAANPALGIRINLETVEDELNEFSPRSFARERLNMWPSPVEDRLHAFPPGKWDERAIEDAPESWSLAAIGLDMNPERTMLSISAATRGDVGPHLEVVMDEGYSDTGAEAVVDWVFKRARRRLPVVIDAFSPARSFEPMLKARGCKVFILSASEFGQACMGLHDAVRDGAMTHFGQEHLDMSVSGARKEPMGKAGAWKFARASLDVDLRHLMSATCAYYGAIKAKPRKAGGSSGKVVVL